jgi:hypothetical protein
MPALRHDVHHPAAMVVPYTHNSLICREQACDDYESCCGSEQAARSLKNAGRGADCSTVPRWLMGASQVGAGASIRTPIITISFAHHLCLGLARSLGSQNSVNIQNEQTYAHPTVIETKFNVTLTVANRSYRLSNRKCYPYA